MTDVSNSIGVFDSGLGGLTVVRSLKKLLPYENIVYFGDTGRVPYGTRSNDVIRQYALQDAKFLLSKNIKMIIAACGTVSSVASDVCKDLGVPFMGVVEPACIAASNATKSGKIGVLGTTATINSNSHKNKLLEINPDFKVFQKNCPLFVSVVEEGFFNRNDPIAQTAVKRYLEPIKNENVDTLILGCTHFPLLMDAIGDYMGPGVTLIDNGNATAAYAADFLHKNGLLNPQTVNGKKDFFVSDEPQGFSKLAGFFLGEEISNVTQVNFD